MLQLFTCIGDGLLFEQSATNNQILPVYTDTRIPSVRELWHDKRFQAH